MPPPARISGRRAARAISSPAALDGRRGRAYPPLRHGPTAGLGVELAGVERRTPRGRCPQGHRARQGPDGPMSRSSTHVARAPEFARRPRSAGSALHAGSSRSCLPALLRHSPAGVVTVRVAHERDQRDAGVLGLDQGGDQVGSAGPERRVADPHAARDTGEAVGHERAAALVVHEVSARAPIPESRRRTAAAGSPPSRTSARRRARAASTRVPARPRARASSRGPHSWSQSLSCRPRRRGSGGRSSAS